MALVSSYLALKIRDNSDPFWTTFRQIEVTAVPKERSGNSHTLFRVPKQSLILFTINCVSLQTKKLLLDP